MGKKSTTCDTSKGVSICLCTKFSIRASFLIRTRDHYKQKGKIISKNYISFDDLKSWNFKDGIDNNVEELGEDDD